MNLETKITIYKFTPQLFTLTHIRGPAEISHHQINKRGSSYVPLSYSLYRNNINENITNKAVKEFINQKPFSYLCSTNFMKMSERK